MGKCTAWDSSSTESSELYSTGSPGNCATKAVLIVQARSQKFPLEDSFGQNVDLFGNMVDLFYKAVDLLNKIEDIFSKSWLFKQNSGIF